VWNRFFAWRCKIRAKLILFSASFLYQKRLRDKRSTEQRSIGTKRLLDKMSSGTVDVLSPDVFSLYHFFMQSGAPYFRHYINLSRPQPNSICFVQKSCRIIYIYCTVVEAIFFGPLSEISNKASSTKLYTADFSILGHPPFVCTIWLKGTINRRNWDDWSDLKGVSHEN